MSEKSEIAELREEIELLKEQLAGFVPLTVDLRINGTVRPVVIFARQEVPTGGIFTVVK